MNAKKWNECKTQTPRQHILLRPYAKTLGFSQINRGRLTGVAEVYRESAFHPNPAPNGAGKGKER